MIQANELRIGNLVYADTGLLSTEIHELLTEDMIDLFNGKLNDLIKPVPLTEQILLKCGFEKLNKRWLLMEYFVKGLFRINYDKGQFFIFWNLNNITEIKYLHQLQNLYSDLTGEELKIEL